MREDFLIFWDSLWTEIPFYVYEIGTAVFCIGVAIFLFRFGIRRGLRWSVGLFLIEYLGLIYCSTVIFRGTSRALQFHLMPFWSYLSYFRGENDRLLADNIMNMVVFVPVGFLAGISFRGFCWRKALALGAGLSIVIEVLQLVMRRGFSEVDDVVHNTLGCMIGYGFYLLIMKAWSYYMNFFRLHFDNKKW